MASTDSNVATGIRGTTRDDGDDSDIDDSDAETVTLTDGDVQVLPETDDDDVIEISDDDDDTSRAGRGPVSQYVGTAEADGERRRHRSWQRVVAMARQRRRDAESSAAPSSSSQNALGNGEHAAPSWQRVVAMARQRQSALRDGPSAGDASRDVRRVGASTASSESSLNPLIQSGSTGFSQLRHTAAHSQGSFLQNPLFGPPRDGERPTLDAASQLRRDAESSAAPSSSSQNALGNGEHAAPSWQQVVAMAHQRRRDALQDAESSAAPSSSSQNALGDGEHAAPSSQPRLEFSRLNDASSSSSPSTSSSTSSATRASSVSTTATPSESSSPAISPVGPPTDSSSSSRNSSDLSTDLRRREERRDESNQRQSASFDASASSHGVGASSSSSSAGAETRSVYIIRLSSDSNSSSDSGASTVASAPASDASSGSTISRLSTSVSSADAASAVLPATSALLAAALSASSPSATSDSAAPSSASAAGIDGDSALGAEDSPRRKRKRDESSAGDTPKKVQIHSLDDSNESDDGEACPICFEDWSNAGDHRVAALKCGHLFGLSCIKKWLDGSGKKCPQCNEPAKKKDVRVIFCKRLKAIDTAERDRALEDLEAEKKRRLQVESTVADLRVKLEIERTEKNKLRKDLEDARTELRGALINAIKNRAIHGPQSPSSSSLGGDAWGSTSSAGPSTGSSSGSFVLRRKGAVGDGGSRLVEFCRRSHVIVVSRQHTNALFPGFGVQMIQPDFSQQKYIPLHTKLIKCLAINHRSMLLSVSQDKQIKITSLNSGNPVTSYMSARAAASCAWDRNNEHVFYVGLDGGLIHAYDTRLPQTNPPAPDDYVKSLPKMSVAPVVALSHVCPASSSAASLRGLLVGHMDGKCVFYEEKPLDPSHREQQQSQQSQPRNDGPQALQYEPHVLPLEGNLISLNLEPSTQEFLATFRPNSKYPRVRHVYGKLGRAVGDSSRITCLGIKVIEGGISQSVISKSALIPRSSYSNSSSPSHSSLICAGDEESKAAFLWDVATGSRVQQIREGAAVLDVCHFPSRGRGGGLALALLSDKTLAVYDYEQSLS